MNWDQFLKQIGLLTAATAVTIFLLSYFLPLFNDAQDLSWIALVSLLLLSVLMFFFGRRAALSDNKHNFTNVVVGFVVGKMALCVAIIIIYNQTVQPASKMFLLPFFLIYVAYTAYECFFMIRLGKMNA